MQCKQARRPPLFTVYPGQETTSSAGRSGSTTMHDAVGATLRYPGRAPPFSSSWRHGDGAGATVWYRSCWGEGFNGREQKPGLPRSRWMMIPQQQARYAYFGADRFPLGPLAPPRQHLLSSAGHLTRFIRLECRANGAMPSARLDRLTRSFAFPLILSATNLLK